MKLKQWLREYKNMSYADFKQLDEDEQYELRYDHQHFNQIQQKKDKGWRPATKEESEYFARIEREERKRFEHSRRIGGTDGVQYRALHYRWMGDEPIEPSCRNLTLGDLLDSMQTDID